MALNHLRMNQRGYPGAFQRLGEMFEAEKAQKKSQQPLIIRHHDEAARRFRGANAS